MENKKFYQTFFKIGWPIALQHMIMSSLNFVDTLMIGGLGEAAVAAVGIANKLSFIYIICLFGIYSAGGIFTAQYFGSGDLKSLHKMLGAMVTFGFIFSLGFLMIAQWLPTPFMQLFIRDGEVVAIGREYLLYTSPAFLVMAVSFAFSFTSRSIHMTQYPMYISIVSLSLNTLLNYSLIYGHFGAPALGVKGAAIATFTSRIVEFFVYLLVIFVLVDHPLRAKLKDYFSYNMTMVRRFVKKGLPVFFNEASWVIGQSVFFIAYGMLGKAALASVQIAMTISDIFVSFFVGISTASSVMIGNELGRADFAIAREYSGRAVKIAVRLSLIVMVVLFVVGLAMPNIYSNFSEHTQRMAMLTTFVMALTQLPRMYNYIATIGILRSGGDTLFTMSVDLLGVWLIGIPMAFIGAYFEFPIFFVVAMAFSEEIIKMFPLILRVRSNKWLNNLIE